MLLFILISNLLVILASSKISDKSGKIDEKLTIKTSGPEIHGPTFIQKDIYGRSYTFYPGYGRSYF